MNTTLTATKGQTVCRDSEWFDVARFFLLNYALHVFTVLLRPGFGFSERVAYYCLSLFIPLYGIAGVLDTLIALARRQPDQLHVALKSGALCMLVPCTHKPEEHTFMRNTIIHGQFPGTVWTAPTEAETAAGVPRWCLRVVPNSFRVTPPLGAPAVPLEISCNYSILTATAGIVQVVSASTQIYHASERQIPQYGYAAYSLTVVPYLLMSVLNLVGSICQPQYPTMFLVRYRGVDGPAGPRSEEDEMQLLPLQETGELQPQLGGTVGDAYGDLTVTMPNRASIVVRKALFLVVVCVAPYVIIAVLTGFKPANSTVAQRTWIMLSMVLGQTFFLIMLGAVMWSERNKRRLMKGVHERLDTAVIGVLLCVAMVPAVGRFVVVAQMIIQDEMCFRV